LKPWLHVQWCLPTIDGEFVARMEDLLDLYADPREPALPVVCYDEKPVQFLADAAPSLPVEPGQAARIDYEYARQGTGNLLACFQPLGGWRTVEVSPRRTRQDFARVMRRLVVEDFPDATRIRVVLDNLSTHTLGALYETFPADEARRIASKLEFHYTPKHASWLNMVEIEFAVLERQCLGRRIPDQATMQHEIDAWQARRNARHATVEWRFTTPDARMKFQRRYPTPS
jgi:hypothetical protein